MARSRLVLVVLAILALPSDAAEPASGMDSLVVEHYADITAKYGTSDLTNLLKPRRAFIGFIGDGYQRLQIVFTSLVRDAAHPAVYRVTGYSIVKTNRCDFKGEIEITKIEAGKVVWHHGSGQREELPQTAGSIEARYKFREDARHRHSGVFAGTMSVDIYIDRNGQLLYNDLNIDSDGYDNNQYVGTWTAYRAGAVPKIANWGEWRVPNSGDLDVGVDEFYPNEKYKENGWQDYRPLGG